MEISPDVPQKKSAAQGILLFLTFLGIGVWTGLTAFGYGFACGLGMGEGFDCKVISPYFFLSTLVLTVFSFFVFKLRSNPKKLLRWSVIILLLFAGGPWIAKWTYQSLPKEARLNLDGFSVEQCQKKGDLCFSRFASYMSDVRMCEYIEEQEEKERCYFDDTGYGSRGVYKANLKQSDCTRLSNTYQRESCRNYFIAQNSRDAGRCDAIQDGFDRWLCWGSVARDVAQTSFNRGDLDFRENYQVTYRPDDCSAASSDYLRDYCYFKYVGSLNETPRKGEPLREVQWCDRIQNVTMRQDCKNGWGVVSGQIR